MPGRTSSRDFLLKTLIKSSQSVQYAPGSGGEYTTTFVNAHLAADFLEEASAWCSSHCWSYSEPIWMWKDAFENWHEYLLNLSFPWTHG